MLPPRTASSATRCMPRAAWWSAAKVFSAMARQDVYTYRSMISGLATHARDEDALALLADMVSRLNSNTFASSSRRHTWLR